MPIWAKLLDKYLNNLKYLNWVLELGIFRYGIEQTKNMHISTITEDLTNRDVDFDWQYGPSPTKDYVGYHQQTMGIQHNISTGLIQRWILSIKIAGLQTYTKWSKWHGYSESNPWNLTWILQIAACNRTIAFFKHMFLLDVSMWNPYPL